MHRIQSSPKRHLINLIFYLGVKLKKTLAVTREASSVIYVPQSFKPKIKKSFIALKILQKIIQFLCFLASSKYFVNCLWTFALLHLFPHVSQV